MAFVSVVGARPQFVKLAPVCQAFAARSGEGDCEVSHSIVHTGQHYDDAMSNVFFDELEIPAPNVNLEVGSAGHGAQTGEMLARLEERFLADKPNVVIVYGDTNSTLAACLAATKLHIPVAHIEAGLRSFNRAMPEEINRVATDHCSDRLYAPTPAGIENLRNENLAERTVFSGDVMRDTVIRNLAIAERRQQKSAADNPEPYAVLTLHRPVNTEPEVLQSLLPALDAIAQKTVPLVFPVHPRIKAAINSPGFSLSPAIKLVEPLAYLEMLCTVKGAQFVLTDSGGLQKEAAFLGTQCITLRDETEWTETVDIGVNRLTGVDTNAIQRAVDTAMSQQFDTETMAALDRCFGDGNAAEFIVQDLISNFCPRY